MITIDQIMAIIDDNYEPTRAELLLLIDIVRDCKLTGYPLQITCSGIKAKNKEIDDISIMELFDYKIKINHESFIKLTDKKRLFIDNNRNNFKGYKQKF
jgi:hypothetical protein